MWIFNRYFKNKENQHWSVYEYFNPKWKKRIFEMSKLITPAEKSVLDLGCGKMWLKDYLKPGIKYYGCDYVSRDKNTIVCDFSKKEFPGLNADVCFASGVIEYVEDLSWFFSEIGKHSSALVCSYCNTDSNNDVAKRKKTGWVNHLSSAELISAVEKNGNFLLQERTKTIPNNEIYRFSRAKK